MKTKEALSWWCSSSRGSSSSISTWVFAAASRHPNTNPDQCDQIGRFLHKFFLATNCSIKIARIFWWHFGLFLIMSLWCKKCVATVWAFFISSSGHTWHLKVNNVPTYLPTWLLDHLFFLLLAQDIYTQVGTRPYFLSLSFYQANTLSMELFSSRRWRLYRPKQKAVVFMLNLKTFYNKHMALFHRCLTVGSILLVKSSMHYLSLSLSRK